MDFTSCIIPLILLCNISGCLFQYNNVSCSPRTICGLRESEVTWKCSFSNIHTIIKAFWFSFKQKAKWRIEEHPEDLNSDPDYTGRLSPKSLRSSLSLTIRDLRETDSGEYHVLIITARGQELRSSTGVHLTVTDLWVDMTTDHEQQRVTLTCNSSCSLTPKNFWWYKNGVKTPSKSSKPLVLSSSASCSDAGSYSCSADEIRSSELRVDESCWNVAYTERELCALEGSSVDFHCTYAPPSNQTVTGVFWYYEQLKDLFHEAQFAGRVEFIGDRERNCTLRMRGVRKTDSGEYDFQFSTNADKGRFSGTSGVLLNVTGLQVKVIPSTLLGGQTIILICSSTCVLPNNHTYLWYKNGQPVTSNCTRDNKLYLNSPSTKELHLYSCAVGGNACNLQGGVRGPVLLTVGISAFLVLMITIAARWMWRRRSRSAEGHRTTVEIEQDDSDPVYSNISALALTPDPTWRASDDQANALYYNLPFKRPHSQETPAHQANLTKHTSESLHYAVVNFHRPAGATQSLPADAPSQIYSQIQKRKPMSGEKNTQRHRGAQWVFRAEGPGALESEEHHRDQRLWVNC